MQVKVLGSLSKRDGIDALTSGDLLHKMACIPYSTAPIGGFFLRKIHGPRTVPQGIQQKPAGEGCWIGVVAQQPEARSLNLETLSGDGVGMQLTDGAVFHKQVAQRRTTPRPLPIKPKSMISPIKTTKSPLNEDTPPNDATAQQ